MEECDLWGGGGRARGAEEGAAEAAGGLLGEGREFVVEVGLVGVAEFEGEFGEGEMGIAEEAGPAFGEAEDFGDGLGREAEFEGEAALEVAGGEAVGAGQIGDGEAAGGGGEGGESGGERRGRGGMAEEPGFEQSGGFGEAGGGDDRQDAGGEGIEGGGGPAADTGGKQAGAEDADGAVGADADDAGLEAEEEDGRKRGFGGGGVEEEGIAGSEDEFEAAIGPDFLDFGRGRIVDAPEAFDAGEGRMGRVFGVAHSSGYRGAWAQALARGGGIVYFDGCGKKGGAEDGADCVSRGAGV